MTASFSEKQLRAMTWWMPKSRDHGFDALVCDGAVRSGKTLAMGLGSVSYTHLTLPTT